MLPLQEGNDIPLQRALELDIVYSCNLKCLQCNRALGIFPSSERMTVSQVKKVLNESLALPHPFQDIRILGGEPTLHPQLPDILALLEYYHNQVNGSVISLWSNGTNRSFTEKLVKLSPWLTLRISTKDSPFGGDSFEPFLAAPRDFLDATNEDYANGCTYIHPGKCGVGASPYGIYVCPVAAAIDRILGKDIGLKSLLEISGEAFRKQCVLLCSYCGHYLYSHGVSIGLETISESWHALIEDMHSSVCHLSRY